MEDKREINTNPTPKPGSHSAKPLHSSCHNLCMYHYVLGSQLPFFLFKYLPLIINALILLKHLFRHQKKNWHLSHYVETVSINSENLEAKVLPTSVSTSSLIAKVKKIKLWKQGNLHILKTIVQFFPEELPTVTIRATIFGSVSILHKLSSL